MSIPCACGHCPACLAPRRAALQAAVGAWLIAFFMAALLIDFLAHPPVSPAHVPAAAPVREARP